MDIAKAQFKYDPWKEYVKQNPWREYAIGYYFQFGPQYDSKRFEKLFDRFRDLGFSVNQQELINYITTLSSEKIKTTHEILIKTQNSTNEGWKKYAINYSLKNSSAYNFSQFANLHREIVEKGYFVSIVELALYVTKYLPRIPHQEFIHLQSFDDSESWHRIVEEFHNGNTSPYNHSIYSELLKRIHENGFHADYPCLISYIGTLGKSKAVIQKEEEEEERRAKEQREREERLRIEKAEEEERRVREQREREERLRIKKAEEEERRARERRERKERLRIEKAEEEERRIKQINISNLRTSPDYNLIVEFAKKIGENHSDKDLSLLVHLINSRNHRLDESIIKELIVEEIQIQKDEHKYLMFVKKIDHDCPENFEGYLENFYKFFSIDDDDHFDYFLKYMRSVGFYIDGEEFVYAYKSLEVKKFEEFLSNRDNAKIITINDIDDMSGQDFERFLSKLFMDQGFEVLHTQSTHDQGADLIIKGYGEILAIQAKCYTNQNIGNFAVQEITAAVNFYNADRGIVITNSQFSQSAINLAHSNNVVLVNRQGLIKLLESDFSVLEN